MVGLKTRDRIIATSLELFNSEGENNVSTNHIADAMDISPGNLYYHFRNKDDIILEIFKDFRREIETLLMAPDEQSIDMEDMWLFLHLIFETIWRYRFFYHNLVDLTRRLRSLRIHFNHIVRQKAEAAARVCKGLKQAEIIIASDDEIAALADNIALVSTYWLNFSTIRAGDKVFGDNLGPAVYQVMSLVGPHLREPERSHLQSRIDISSFMPNPVIAIQRAIAVCRVL